MSYKEYISYRDGRRPKVLDQEYPVPLFPVGAGKTIYPLEEEWSKVFLDERERGLFCAFRLGNFLRDTIRIEHTVVIPAIAAMEAIGMPSIARQDMMKIVTDEGFHAEQANLFSSSIEKYYEIDLGVAELRPSCLSSMDRIINQASDETEGVLGIICAAIATETKISSELGRFSRDESLTDEVRRICELHAQDERTHASQFRALCLWIWDSIPLERREYFLLTLCEMTVAFNVLDLKRLSVCLMRTTGRSYQECREVVHGLYDPDKVVRLARESAKPTEMLIAMISDDAMRVYESEIDRATGSLRDQ